MLQRSPRSEAASPGSTSAASVLDAAAAGLSAARGVVLGVLLATSMFWVPAGAAAWWLLG